MHIGRTLPLFAGLCAGVASVTWAASDLPSWVDHPKSDDSVFLYRIGYSEGQKDPVTARQDAYRQALSVIVGEMLARAGVEESLRPELGINLPIQNAEMVPGAVYTETNAAGVRCWVQVSYPLTEKAKLLERIEPEKKQLLARIESGKRIASLFDEARAAQAKGDHEAAMAHLQTVIQNYPVLRAPPFELPEAQLLLGDIYCARKDFLAARQCYDGVLQTANSAKWKSVATMKAKALPKAPRAWPLHDRWHGRKTALVCAMRNTGEAPRPFAGLGQVLGRDCREARLESVDLSGEMKSDEVAGLFDQRSLAAITGVAKQKGAGMILAVMLATDPAKRGQTKEVMGVAMPVVDSEVSFLVIDVEGSAVLYGDRFSEITGTRSDSQCAERVASLLVEKYLIPKCPALGGK